MSTTQHAIPELDRKGLRSFGITTGIIVAVLFGLFFPWLLERSTPYWAWVLAGVLIVWGLVAPATLRPVYRVWMRFGLLMSRITTPLVLGIVFFLIITPVGLIRNLFGRDSIPRKFDDSSSSYRVQSKRAPRENLERPF